MSAADGTVAVLWGSVTKELNWIHISAKHGRTTLARAHTGGFWVREFFPVDGIDLIAERAMVAWSLLRDGQDLADWATHRLAPPLMRDIEPLPAKDAT